MKRKRRTDPHIGLLRQIARRFPADGRPLLLESKSDPWMSATFSGARHSYRFALENAGQEAWLKAMRAEISEAEFDLPDHIVADIVLEACAADAPEFVIEALSVEMG